MRVLLGLTALAFVFAGCASGPLLVHSDETAVSQYKAAPWPAEADAKIRPGAVVVVEDAACTANFMFRTPDNATLYLGVAAHCFGLDPADAVPIGTPATIGGIRGAGEVAYNGWAHENTDQNDFGLVKILNKASARGFAHPAMIYYGGPTGLAPSENADIGTRVMSYGNSVQRGEDDPENPREGRVILHADDLLSVVTNYPGIQGDSGSGLLTAEGKGVGVLSTGIVNPLSSTVPDRQVPTVNNYVELDTVLAKAQAADPSLANLQLVTWKLIRGPSLPVAAEPLPTWPVWEKRYL